MRIHLFELTDAARRADELLLRMEQPARDELAREAQRRASALGLMRGAQPIPLVLSPSSLPRDELAALGRNARLVTSALVKVARRLIEGQPEKAGLLFHHLSPLEREALAHHWREAEDLLHSRIDWFVDRQGTVRALEVNATIPAMHVYSDAAARGWVEAVRPGRAAALARNPSNAAWLVDALLKVASGRAHRVLYRHLFARHVEVDSQLGRAFLDPVKHGMWNRVDGWLETKGLFAELSLQARADYLSQEERDAVAETVPWTRLLDDIDDATLGGGDRFVLKRSHDYGGKSVVIGREAGPKAFRETLRAARRDEPGTWVAQELVDAPSIERFLSTGTGVPRLPLHLDISTYASLVPGVPDGGSVCRAAPGRIVNIVRGGGVAPL